MLFRRGSSIRQPIPTSVILIQFAAAVFVGLSTWARWFALDLAPVGVVLALSRLNVPVVILLSPILIGRHLERVTWKVWLGAFLVILGSIILAISG
jgi:uncharacterized membrane protein